MATNICFKKRAASGGEPEDDDSSARNTTSKVVDGAEKALVSEEQKKQDSTKAVDRLSSSGAPPMNRRVVKQNLIKRRRLIGQPPSMKLSPSPTVKAALGVKRKLVLWRFYLLFFHHIRQVNLLFYFLFFITSFGMVFVEAIYDTELQPNYSM